MFKVGYGSTRMSQQQLIDVSQFQYCGDLDVAVLITNGIIPPNPNMEVFTFDKWRMDDVGLLRNRT